VVSSASRTPDCAYAKSAESFHSVANHSVLVVADQKKTLALLPVGWLSGNRAISQMITWPMPVESREIVPDKAMCCLQGTYRLLLE
jgi:hypothetical protein